MKIGAKNKHFFFGLISALLIAISIHVYFQSVYEFVLFGSFVIASYVFNLGFVVMEVLFLSRYQRKEGANLGNAYLGLSMLKFLIFFAVFMPLFKIDGVTDRFEFFGFFVPYAICLAAGTAFLIKMLQEPRKKS